MKSHAVLGGHFCLVHCCNDIFILVFTSHTSFAFAINDARPSRKLQSEKGGIGILYLLMLQKGK